MLPIVAVLLGAAPDLHATAQQAFKARHLAGMVVAVRRGDRPLLLEAFGAESLEHDVKASPASVFHFDSITKNVTATAVLQLTEAGKLTLADDVRKWVPDLPAELGPLTVRQLLDHTSGLPSFDTLPEFEKVERLDLQPPQILALLKAAPRPRPAGQSWAYTNTGFYLAGQVIERASGQSYADYLRAHVFEPAGMTHARVDTDAAAIVAHRAEGYAWSKDHFVRAPALSWVPVSSAGAISGTALDLLDYLSALDGGKLLGRESLELMRAPTPLPGTEPVDYGLGTRRGSLDGHPMFGHTGGGGGYSNVFVRWPADQLSVVVLSNTDGAEVVPIAIELGRVALGLPAPGPPAERPLTAEASQWVGTYDAGPLAIEVSLVDAHLAFKPAGAPIAPTVMPHLGGDVFSVGPGRTVHLVPAGKSAAATVYLNGLMVDYGRKR